MLLCGKHSALGYVASYTSSMRMRHDIYITAKEKGCFNQALVTSAASQYQASSTVVIKA